MFIIYQNETEKDTVGSDIYIEKVGRHLERKHLKRSRDRKAEVPKFLSVRNFLVELKKEFNRRNNKLSKDSKVKKN